MKTLFPTISATVILASCLASTATGQADSQAQAVKNYLAGQKFLVTYRQGGPVYGTYFFLDVQLCRSGSYVTFGQSRKQNVVYERTEQVHSWRDYGKWDVVASGGQLGVQYLSSSGQSSFYPVSIGPNGQVYTSNGMTIVRKGAAECR